MYDAKIGRFISADTTDPNPANPQTLNRYSYCLNNPLKYIDPDGHEAILASIIAYITTLMSSPDLPMDMQQFAFDAANRDYASMAMDAIGVAVPGLTAASIKGSLKAAQGAVYRGAKILNKVGMRGNVISKATKESGKIITVIGALKDTARFKGKVGFNVLEEVLEKTGKTWTKAGNIQWLNDAFKRGDEIWAVTNPKKHAKTIEKLRETKPGIVSKFLDLEIPHIKEKTGINIRDKF